MNPTNQAAWQTAAKSKPLDVKEAPYTSPGEKEIVVQVKAIAINPVDWSVQELGEALFAWLKYPTILGTDLAGEVVEVGSGITRFKPGDRVVAFAAGPIYNVPSQSAFQNYTVVLEALTAEIPNSISYESASVIPLGLATASAGLFQKDYLSLELPRLNAPSTGKTLLVWGGSTSVGTNAIQLAVAAGYEVISTSSPRNFDYLKKLGASQVFDYNSPTVVDDLIAAFKGKVSAGAIAIANVTNMSNGSASEPCLKVVQASEGAKFVAMTMPFNPADAPEGVSAKFIFGNSIKDNEVGPAVFADYLPKALAAGSFVASPEPLVVGQGLESVQGAFLRQKQGLSAQKAVVTL